MSRSDSDSDFDLSALGGNMYSPPKKKRQLKGTSTPKLKHRSTSTSHTFLDSSPETSPVKKEPLFFRSAIQELNIDFKKFDSLDKSKKLREQLNQEKIEADEENQKRKEEEDKALEHLSLFARQNSIYTSWVLKQHHLLGSNASKDFFFIHMTETPQYEQNEDLNLYSLIPKYVSSVSEPQGLDMDQFLKTEVLDYVKDFQFLRGMVPSISEVENMLRSIGLQAGNISLNHKVSKTQLTTNPKYQLPSWRLNILQLKLNKIFEYLLVNCRSQITKNHDHLLIRTFGLLIMDPNYLRSELFDGFLKLFHYLLDASTSLMISTIWLELTNELELHQRILDTLTHCINIDREYSEKYLEIQLFMSYNVIVDILNTRIDNQMESLKDKFKREREQEQKVIDSVLGRDKNEDEHENQGHMKFDLFLSKKNDEKDEEFESEHKDEKQLMTSTLLESNANNPASARTTELLSIELYLRNIVTYLSEYKIPKSATEEHYYKLWHLFYHIRYFINTELDKQLKMDLFRVLDVINQDMRDMMGSLNGTRLRAIVRESYSILEDICN